MTRKAPWPATWVEHSASPLDGLWRVKPGSALPDNAPRKLKDAFDTLHVANSEVSRLVHQFEMLSAVVRLKTAQTREPTPLCSGVWTLQMSLMLVIVTGLAGLFDTESGAVNLLSIATCLNDERFRPVIEAEHARRGHGDWAVECLNRLLRVRRRIKKSVSFGASLAKLKGARHKIVAHHDVKAGRAISVPSVRDVKVCLVAAIRLADLCSQLLHGHFYDLAVSRDRARENAEAIVRLIRAGEHLT
jgi:hypothetical protein